MSKNYLTPEEIFAQKQKSSAPTPKRLARIQHTARHRQAGLIVMMEDVHNPHNLAAIARSCDAFGVQTLGFSLENDALFDPRTIGKVSSSSASKWLDYRIFEQGTQHALTTLKDEGYTLLATVLSDRAISIHDLNFTEPRFDKLVVLVGNEREGLSDVAREMADVHMMIPMMGMIQSFNVSVATALTLFEVTRQRHASERNYYLSDDEAETLVQDFLRRP
jgi:tRNA (guanosine-2'-O-)-methyltransferase